VRSQAEDLAGGPGSSTSGRRAALLAVAADQFAISGYSRTSLRQIADAAGILPGSLYHHFESKEAIAVELVQVMARDMEAVTSHRLAAHDEPVTALRVFAREVTALAARHPAAVEIVMRDDGPATATARLTEMIHTQPSGLLRAWQALVDRAARDGRLRSPEVDRRLLRLAMHHATMGLGKITPGVSSTEVADTVTSVLLDGLWAGPPARHRDGLARVDEVVAAAATRWADTRREATGRQQLILSAAREEFARRGFEATTMRGIADAIGMKAASLYRHFPSKDALLTDIMARFSGPLLAAMEEVVAAAGSPTVALEGFFGLMSLAGLEFDREYEIQKIWWQQLASQAPDSALAQNRRRFALLRTVLADGITTGEFRHFEHVDTLAICVRELLWLPFHGVSVRPEKARSFFRQTVGAGAVAR
jgi:AcrR family transcriptional regulator